MPRFDTSPPVENHHSGYRLIRTPASHPLLAHVLSDNLIGCRTHYVANRTIPCETPHCEHCEAGIGWRWHGYLAVILDSTQEIVLFECTARAAEAFAAYYQRHTTTRGCHFKAVRYKSRHNGRVLIQAKPGDLAKINLPPAPSVEKLLCHIWNIPPSTTRTTDHKPRNPHENLEVTSDQAPQPIPTLPLTQTIAAGTIDAPRKSNNKGDPSPCS